jgi:hypothetical protein
MAWLQYLLGTQRMLVEVEDWVMVPEPDNGIPDDWVLVEEGMDEGALAAIAAAMTVAEETVEQVAPVPVE